MSWLLKKSVCPGKISCMLLFVFQLFTLFLAGQTLPTPGSERLKSMADRQTRENNSPFNEISFRNIGPTIMGGRVVDVDVNADNPTEFYIAYASGGVWYTVNNGQSFTPITDNMDLSVIGDIAVNWTAPNRIIWVGTGEPNSSRSSYAGTGIYKTSDNGKNWQFTGLPESHHIGKIQLHPSDVNTVWVAALGHLYSANKERGVYKTTDGGKNWKQTLYIDDNTGAVDLDINPSNPNELYAAMWYRTRRAWNFEESGRTSGIYKSTNGGESWQQVSVAGSGFMTGDKIGRIGIAVFPKNPNIIYAVVDNNTPKPDTTKVPDSFYTRALFKTITKEDFALLKTSLLDTFLRKNNFPRRYNARDIKEQVATGKIKSTSLWEWLDVGDNGLGTPSIVGCEIYRSDDGGKTWKKTHVKPNPNFNTYGYYFAKVYTSHSNPDKIYSMGFIAQLSTDGGKTFKTIDKNNVHADHHALWVNPKVDSHIINGNDGGANISYDSGENWFKINTPPVGQFYAITVDDAKPYNVYGGLQDNGSWWGPSNHKEDIGWVEEGQYPFKRINGGDGMQAQVDTRDNATVYSGFQFGVYARYNKERRGAQKAIRPIHELGEKPMRFNWQTPIQLSKHNQDVLYYGSNRFYRSLNKADTMIAMSNDLTNGRVEGNVPYGTLTTISESPLRFGLIYTGTDDGNIHLTKDGGYSWEQLNEVSKASTSKSNKSNPPGGKLQTNKLWVSRVIASQHKENRAYTTLNGYRNDDFTPYLYVSDDYGQSWKRIGTDLPLEPVNVVREDPKNDSILYVGTDGGVYVSFDRGNSFMTWTAGLPKSVPVHDIAIQARDNEIVLGTHGRSLFVSKLDDIQGIKKDKDWMKNKPKEKKETERRRGETIN
jgi:photosystem II stability/assembly factor-like uncharacterized protein